MPNTTVNIKGRDIEVEFNAELDVDVGDSNVHLISAQYADTGENVDISVESVFSEIHRRVCIALKNPAQCEVESYLLGLGMGRVDRVSPDADSIYVDEGGLLRQSDESE